jgi:trehalose 6-phosphate phosphatase
MRPILEHGQVLRAFAHAGALVAFDYDGTLAPIVERPERAHMLSSTRGRLVEVARRYRCAVLSGRSRTDVAARLGGVPLVEVVGNHGIEPYGDAALFTHTCARWVSILEQALAIPGVTIENKGPSLSIHYRASEQPEEARAAIDDALRRLDGAHRVVLGKRVVNVVPADAPHKGIALQQLVCSLGAERAIYVGDDVTDEDVFAIRDPEHLLSIRVGHDPTSAADYFVPTQREVDHLLEELIAPSPPRAEDARRHDEK